MHKITCIMLLLMGILTFSQCTISGKTSISAGAEETYALANETAQCKDCHLWVGIGGNAVISGDNRQNTVKIKAASGGRQVLSLVYLTPQGVVQCSKNIDITGASTKTDTAENTTPYPEPEAKCNIKINDMKEIKAGENLVIFQPAGEDFNYKYTWTATYLDGREIISKDKNPQFPFGKADGIKKMQVKIISDRCLREFTKNYDANYWMYF